MALSRLEPRADRIDGRSSLATGRHVVPPGVAGVVIASAVTCTWVGAAAKPHDVRPSGHLISSLYDPPRRAVETALIKGDGQIFATQSTDPLLRRTAMIRGGPAEQAYRLQRPLYGWLGWISSLGHPSVVPWALLALTIASVGALTMALAWSIRHSYGSPWLALLIFFAPGVEADLRYVGPDVLGTALVVIGLGLARRGAKRGRWEATPTLGAVACFALAGLCRETLLVFPAVLALVELGRGRSWSRVTRWTLAAVPWLLWVLVLRLRVDAWPTGSRVGRLSLVPFGGLLARYHSWSTTDLMLLGLTFLLAVLAAILTRSRILRLLVLAHISLAAFMGPTVWGWPEGEGRALLPMAALIIVTLSEVACRQDRRKAGTRRNGFTANRPAPRTAVPGSLSALAVLAHRGRAHRGAI